MTEDDFIGAGFHRVDHTDLSRPPPIQWGDGYYAKTPEERISYLEKFCSSMNHAAHLIQGERDELGRLCELKEKQVIQAKAAMDQNLSMLHTTLKAHNAEKQKYNAVFVEQNRRIKELESG